MRRLIIISLLGLMLTNCGVRGNLYLPGEEGKETTNKQGR